jgi:4-diphosphocytidyl-2C-methyl-D-erythritol kinase
VMCLPLRALAPAKINLGLFVGPVRPDGRHELVSVMQSISLADELALEGAPGADSDEVVCPGVSGENLAARALASFREATAWEAPPLRLTIDKRIPIAAGLGGGSADAAAALRLAQAASGLGDEGLLLALAKELGADVPAQVTPGRHLACGAGEILQTLPDPVSLFGVLVLVPLLEALQGGREGEASQGGGATGGEASQGEGEAGGDTSQGRGEVGREISQGRGGAGQAAMLSTAEVYAAADRLGLVRDASVLTERRDALGSAFELGAALPSEECLLHNDLQAASIELCPEIELVLVRVREAGAEVAFVSGSGPTVVGLFARANGLARAERAAAGLAGLEPAPLTAVPVDAGFAAVQRLRT